MKRSSVPDAGAMGALDWGKGGAGKLSSIEKGRLIGNLAYVQVRETFDSLGQRIGFLRPTNIVLDDLLPPQSTLVEDALGLAQETHRQELLFHSWRTYIFGAMMAENDRIEYNRSQLFAASILHDIGLTEGHAPNLCNMCFALSGGERVHRHLLAKGHPPEVGKNVGNAISLHLNAWVSRRQHGAEAHLLSRGAFCDLFGAGKRRISKENLDQVLTRFPRDGVIEALQFETATHRQGTRAGFMTRLAGGRAPSNPFQHVSEPRHRLGR